VYVFFVLKNNELMNFGRFYKICTRQKTSVFSGALGISTLLSEEHNIFQRKKNIHPDLVQVAKKKFSAMDNEIWIFARGKTSGHF